MSPKSKVQSPKSHSTSPQPLSSEERGARCAHSEGPWLFGLVCVFVALAVGGGCSSRPLKGGRALTGGPLVQSVSQGENASQPTRQSQDFIRTYSIPAPILQSGAEAGTSLPTRTGRGAIARSPIQNPVSSIQYPPGIQYPGTIQVREESHATTELGAAQKDTAREIGAKLSSLKSIVWVGVALFVFGLTSLFWPPLKAIIGSVTTSAAIAVGGLALIILPTLIVGNELLILGGVGLAVGGWFLAHRHGHVRGQLHALTGKPATPQARRGN